MTATLQTTPREITSQTTPVAVSGPTTITIPQEAVSGFVWDLRRLVVVDADDPFFVHCDAVVILGTPFTAEAIPNAPDCVDFAAAIPCGLHFSRGTVIVLEQESIVVWVQGAEAGHKLIAAIQVEELRTFRG